MSWTVSRLPAEVVALPLGPAAHLSALGLLCTTLAEAHHLAQALDPATGPRFLGPVSTVSDLAEILTALPPSEAMA